MRRPFLALTVALFQAMPAAAAAQVFLPDTSALTDEQRRQALERVVELERLRLEGETEEYVRRIDALDPEGYLAQCRPMDAEEQRFAASENLPEMQLALGDPVLDILRDYPGYFLNQYGRADNFSGSLNSAQMMRLSVDLGGVVIRSRSGGMGNVVNSFIATSNSKKLYSLSFYDQQCPLVLDEALVRANRIEDQLLDAGFVRDAGRPSLSGVESYGTAQTSEELADWDVARGALAIAPRRFGTVTSYWSRGDEVASVTVHNWGKYADAQMEARYGAAFSRNVHEVDGTGRKYGVSLRLSNSSMRQQDRQAARNGVESAPR